MAWNISAGSIRNPIPPIVLILALLFAGLTAYFRLPINQMPNMEWPAFNVSVAQPGASPAELETQVTQRVEAALSNVQGVHRVYSSVSSGVSETFVELQIGVDLSRAVEDARQALTRIRPDLPAEITEPVIERQDSASEPIGYFAISGEGMTPQELSWFIDNDLTRELLSVSGVSSIQRVGGVDREVRVELDPERLQAYGIPANSVSQQLRVLNADMPGGQAQIGGQSQSIRTLGAATTVEQLSQIRVTAADGRVVRLSDLGAVSDGGSELSAISRYNGQPVVAFQVMRGKTASEVGTFDLMQKKLHEVSAAHPAMRFERLDAHVDFVRGLHEGSLAALIEGALLACLVVLLVLRDWRTTLIAAAAIPLAVIPTFAAMEMLGFTLNMITLIALALVAGVLVDDAIVEIENIVRHTRMGKSPYDAALEAADEIGLAVVATTATIIAVFVPVSFMNSSIGQFFKQFGLTVAFAAFFSLIVARLITPMMAAFFLKDHKRAERPSAFTDAYRALLGWAIRRPGWTVLIGMGISITSFLFAVLTPFTFIPRIDNGTVQVRVEVPPGTPLMEADRVVQAMGAAMRPVPEVRGIFTSLRGVNGAASQGTIYVQLLPRKERHRSAYQVQQDLRPILARFADYRTSFLNFQGGSRGADIEVVMVGQDPHRVSAAADTLVQAIRRDPHLSQATADVRSSASRQVPEIQIRPRYEDATRLGVSSAALASAVRIATSGDVEQNLPRFNLSDRQIPIRVLVRPDRRTDLDTLRALPVQSSLGEPVRLDAVADIKFALGEAAIDRQDRERAVTVSANVIRGVTGDAQQRIFRLPQAQQKNLPAGVHLATSGDTEATQEMFSSFGNAMLWGVILIFGVLVLLFRDFFQPITIMFALPLSIGGAFLGLFVANQPLSLFALIGLLMLMGIVTKNSILLVDFAIEQIHKGMDRSQALMEAGMKRARPIVMTTLAMAAGMIPAAAGWGVDGTLRQGMGAAVIGGLLLSTLLSLVFVPAMFVLIDRLERFVSPLFARVTARRQPTVQYPAE